MSGQICVKYYSRPPANVYEFLNASTQPPTTLTFNLTKTITTVNINLMEKTGNTTINLPGYQACLNVNNARIEDSTLIAFIVTYNDSNEDAFTYINYVVKGNFYGINILENNIFCSYQIMYIIYIYIYHGHRQGDPMASCVFILCVKIYILAYRYILKKLKKWYYNK